MNIIFSPTMHVNTGFSVMMGCTVLAAFFIFFTTVPIFSLLSLVLAYIFAAMSLFLLDLPYVSLVYIILYVGAVCTLFIFLVMLVELRPDAEYIKTNVRKGLMVIFFLGLFLSVILLFELVTNNGLTAQFLHEISFTFDATPLTDTVLDRVEHRDINVLNTFYTQYTRNYPILLLLAAALLIAVIGCIVIAFHRPLIYSAALRKIITLPLLYGAFPFTKPNGEYYILSAINTCFGRFAFSMFFLCWAFMEIYNGPWEKYKNEWEEHKFVTKKQIKQNQRMIRFLNIVLLILAIVIVGVLFVFGVTCFLPWLIHAIEVVIHEIFSL